MKKIAFNPYDEKSDKEKIEILINTVNDLIEKIDDLTERIDKLESEKN